MAHSVLKASSVTERLVAVQYSDPKSSAVLRKAACLIMPWDLHVEALKRIENLKST